ncbi:ABC transporter permease subunit [Streptomyces harbinensis]|uniref:Peptide/nickel transport system permease protein n=1 Tax=Streptomyces harbinensis TaxID=1176198 RepID=A0A1I6VYB4_9ACTN|nr:ABC transporter permease subunit [Streptomyces harbinensis]SFT18679.1 peptide/nickel transport system permease protein [Streptomyces harbinensis]
MSTTRNPGGIPARRRGPALLWRGALLAALVCAIGLLPWLSRTDPALTVLKARALERTADPETLRAVRDELGLDDGPLVLLGRWLGGLARGDAGRSWVSGTEVAPVVGHALGVSLLLMAGALVVALATAAAICGRPLWRGARLRPGGRAGGGGRGGSAALAALPEFLIASLLVAVVGVRLGWLPASGWYGPAWMVLPSLALGLPAGAVLGRLLADALPGAFAEQWVPAARGRGLPPGTLARHALRRAVAGLLPNLGLFVVGLTGGAVAVEQIFDIPGLGRLTLRAALAQDLPVLQLGVLALVALAALAAALVRLGVGALIGPALRDGALQAAHRPGGTRRRWGAPLGYGLVLAAVVALGLPRDPLALDTGLRLTAPSWAHPLGTDALGRDVLARVAHGALTTLGTAVAVSAAALLVGLLLGLVPRLSGPLAETVNAVPAVPAALLITGVVGGGPWTPAVAVAAVAWTPLATHAGSLLLQERAALHVTASRALGAGRGHLLRRVLLPAVLPPVLRHALLRLPGIALSLAALGFLGIGAQPPSPEWGLVLSENQPYVERAPWAVLAPAAVLALLGALAVTAAGAARRGEPGAAGAPGARWRRRRAVRAAAAGTAPSGTAPDTARERMPQ